MEPASAPEPRPGAPSEIFRNITNPGLPITADTIAVGSVRQKPRGRLRALSSLQLRRRAVRRQHPMAGSLPVLRKKTRSPLPQLPRPFSCPHQRSRQQDVGRVAADLAPARHAHGFRGGAGGRDRHHPRRGQRPVGRNPHRRDRPLLRPKPRARGLRRDRNGRGFTGANGPGDCRA
jgi:hypothetical protein